MATKKKTVEITYCDNCGKETFGTKCLGCGKDYCYDCENIKGTEFSFSVNFKGSGDGYYCNECQIKISNDNKHPEFFRFNAFKKIDALKREYAKFYNDFEKRCDEAEKEVVFWNKKLGGND